MVLFDEDPVTLISETTNQFHIAPDRDSLTRISSSLALLTTHRQTTLANQTSTLKTLARRLNTLNSQSEYESTHHDASAHASKILSLDTEKFRVAKNVSDLEVEGERLKSELEGLRRTLAQLEIEGVEGGRKGRREGSEDEVLLKLQLYRGLGVEVQREGGTGEVRRVVGRSLERGDVSVVEIERGVPKGEYTCAIWESL